MFGRSKIRVMESGEMKVEMLRAYNSEDLADLHKKVIELSDQIQYEDYEPARNAIVALMHVYVKAIENILNPKPVSFFPFGSFHPNTEEDLNGELKHHQEFRDEIKLRKGE